MCPVSTGHRHVLCPASTARSSCVPLHHVIVSLASRLNRSSSVLCPALASPRHVLCPPSASPRHVLCPVPTSRRHVLCPASDCHCHVSLPVLTGLRQSCVPPQHTIVSRVSRVNMTSSVLLPVSTCDRQSRVPRQHDIVSLNCVPPPASTAAIPSQ